MCGIYGMVTFGEAVPDAAAVVERMGQTLRHRGPDDHAVLASPHAMVGTERLRITDPLPRAAQPFTTPDGTVWLGCNGAIYNAADLRARYCRYPYRSRSDIEPILPLYLDRGPAGVAELDGMFALAIWDARRARLLLVRDRAGEKPLFYARLGDAVWFASEVQALLEHPHLPRDLDSVALDEYLTFGYVPEPRTMFSTISKVEAGTVVSFDAQGHGAMRYWVPELIPVEPMSTERAEQRLADHLQLAVRKQLAADVPVGVFTSGGLDSSLLATLAARARTPTELHTFTVGFGRADFDESAYANALAQRLGTRHLTVRVRDHDLHEAFDLVTHRVAEPIADPAILPTCLLAQAAREHVGVVLSGEGADELFGGYPTYLGHRAAPAYAALPATAKRAVRGIVNALPTSTGKVPLEFLLKRFVAHAELETLERHVAWFGTGLDLGTGAEERHDPPWLQVVRGDPDPLRQAMLFDYLTYLRDDLLPKVDHATMLFSLEARSPFLDRDLTTCALGLPTSLKLRGLTTKWLLKRVARRWLPRRVVHRRKRGLSVPVAAWINDGLRTEADRLLDADRLRAQGVLRGERVRQLLSEHRRGRANHARALWPLVVYERWRERWLGD
jgi:asparagine synthase (glutamine-hydrolysing)